MSFCSKSIFNKKLALLLALIAIVAFCGCETGKKDDADSLTETVDLNTDVASVTLLHEFDAVDVTGFGIVANLNGSGSSECPPELREVLVKYIKQQTGQVKINANKFIDSLDTAVVQVDGTIPSLGIVGQKFDVTVAALARTQTTSLEGGTLYTTNLIQREGFSHFSQFGKSLAVASGPIFIDKLGGKAASSISGYIIGGGNAKVPVRLSLFLRSPNFLMSSAIRNRLNERFGPGTSKAISPSEVRVTIPEEYQDEKPKFLALVKMVHLSTDSSVQARRISGLIEQLKTSNNKIRAEISLAAIGRRTLDRLAPLLDSPDPAVRFFAARCMLSLGDNRPPQTLRRLIEDRDSAYRLAAINAIGDYARRNDAIPILSPVLEDKNFDLRYAAYEHLKKLNDISVSQTAVAGKLLIDSVIDDGEKIIFASRKGQQKIVLFGSPMQCKKNIFVESLDGKIVINAAAGEKYLSIMKKHPTKPVLIGPVKSSFKVENIIRTLSAATPTKEQKILRPGLNVAYSDLLVMLKEMCDSGAIEAKFIAGPMPQIEVE